MLRNAVHRWNLSVLSPRMAFSNAAAEFPSNTSTEKKTDSYAPSLEEIKQLRQDSSAPIKDCKKALLAAEGNLPLAFEWLRKKGIASATAKAGRSTMEGLIGVHVKRHVASVVEINSETDFVARNATFQELVHNVAESLTIIDGNAHGEERGKEELMSMSVKDRTLEALVPELIGKFGENVSPRRGITLSVEKGSVVSYIHNVVGNDVGRSAALVALQHEDDISDDTRAAVQAFGKRLAMHIVAAKPKYLSKRCVPAGIIEKEKQFLMDEASGSGKPSHILEKMVLGRLNKFFAEVCLLEQNHMVEEDNPAMNKSIQNFNKQHNVDVKVTGYVRYDVGESTSV